MTTRKLTSLALCAATVLVAACGSNHDSTLMQPQNTAPAVSAIGDQSVNQDTVVGPIEFGISDAESDAATLTLVVSNDNTDLIPADGVVLGGEGRTRSLTLTPLESRTGTAHIAVLVTDPAGASTTRSFTVVVNARSASFKSSIVETFDKGENADATPVSGYTFTQDADDSASFATLFPADAP